MDNCPNGSAKGVIDAIAAEHPGRIRYVVESAPGIAQARNAGLRSAETDLIAFLDDDDEAEPQWLASLLETQMRKDADVVFGPVEARLDARPALHPEYFERFYSRRFDALPEGADITARHSDLGTANSLFRRSTCFRARPEPFDMTLGLAGGEDSLLIRQLALDGKRFFWSARARVHEHVQEERLSVGYVCKKKFRSGQIRCETCLKVEHSRPLELMQWMSVGMIQLVGGSLVAALIGPTRSELGLGAVTTAFGGLGKLMWMKPFQLALYRRDP